MSEELTIEELLSEYRDASEEQKEKLRKAILSHPDYYAFIDHKIRLATDDPAEREALRAIFWQESRWNIFAVGDNGQSFGLGQVYKPAHEGWVDFTRLTAPDVGYQVLVSLKILRDAYKWGLKVAEGDELEAWWWAFYRYNGSGAHARWYARRIAGLLLAKPWEKFIGRR